jgi:hypothetical protein
LLTWGIAALVEVMMDEKEIATYIFHRSKVCVDIRIAPKYPELVRKTSFYPDNTACIEFCEYNIDAEEGYLFRCSFPTLFQAISSIEDYLEVPMSDWINHTRTGLYPEFPGIYSVEKYLQGESKLMIDIFNHQVVLPRIGNFTLKGELPFQSYDEYLEFRREIESEIPQIED